MQASLTGGLSEVSTWAHQDLGWEDVQPKSPDLGGKTYNPSLQIWVGFEWA